MILSSLSCAGTEKVAFEDDVAKDSVLATSVAALAVPFLITVCEADCDGCMGLPWIPFLGVVLCVYCVLLNGRGVVVLGAIAVVSGSVEKGLDEAQLLLLDIRPI
jgi:hypothetical protein